MFHYIQFVSVKTFLSMSVALSMQHFGEVQLHL